MLIRRLGGLGALGLALLLAGGCTGILAERMVRAPNARPAGAVPHPPYTTLPWALGDSLDQGGQALRLRRIAVASGAISLRVLVVEPADAPFARTEGGGWRRAWPPTPREPVGTVVLIHGLWGSIDYLAEHAAGFANAGWRAVLIELRGHGESDGDQVTFGRKEAQDVDEVLHRLARDGVLHGPVALVGYSLGGATVIMAAARGAPVDAVVAVAPFAHVRDVAPNFATLAAGWLAWFATAGLTDRVVARAGVIAGFDPVADSPLALVPLIHQPLLLIHGDADTLVPQQQSEQLAAAATCPVTRVLVPGQDHIAVVLEPLFSLPVILPWLRRTFAGRLPPDTPMQLAGPLYSRPGEPETGTCTWNYRPVPWDLSGSWPQPVGVRRLRMGLPIPLPWLYRDLQVDLGVLPRRDETTYSGVVIGRTEEPRPWPGPIHRRYVIPGWAQVVGGELTIRMETEKEGQGAGWAGGGAVVGLVRTAVAP